MKTEKLSGSIWVSEGIAKQLEYLSSNEQSDDYPIELTITAKMPERKREFTEGELREILMSSKTYDEAIDKAFKERE